jgi:exodeoxyribonuclease V gamma subunit
MHLSNQLEELAGILAEMLKDGRDPLDPTIIVVQTPGVARWLNLALADRLGASMGLRFLFPRNFIDEMCGKLLGGETPAHPDCAEMTWRIFAALPSVAVESGDEALENYLKGNLTLRRYELAGKLADLFDRYLVHRPEMIAAWEAGAAKRDWQAILWRTLSAEKQVPHLAALFPRLENAAPDAGTLPDRVFLFGISTLPQLYFNFLQILGKSVRIDLFALAPSAEYWGDLQSARQAKLENALGIDAGFGQILLSSMGKQGKDFFNLLDDAGFNPGSENFVEPGEATMLHRLQSDILHMRQKHAEGDEPDGSIKVVSCAGRMRETEVLRDHILHLFETMPELRPRDILVLAPTISDYAPFVEAVFGCDTSEARIPFSIADKTIREQPLAGALSRVFALASSRRTSREIFSILESPAVAAKFDLDAETLASARRMCLETGVRWGFDASDREKLGFGPEARNSWKAGMDSLTLGIMTNGGIFEGIAPYPDAEGDAAATIGKLTEAYTSLRDAVRAIENDRPLSEWPVALKKCVNLILPDAPEYSDEKSTILTAISNLAGYADFAGNAPVDLASVGNFIETALGESLAPHGFLSGKVTFAELKPMRSVPAKVICLLGMDDEAFPRQDRPPAFDLIWKERREGDRSVREGDRYLFLETLLCARDSLYISYPGVSQHGDADTPPSVVVTELLEFLGNGKTSGFITRHPLQPFSKEYFNGGSPFYSYSEYDCEAAKAGLSKHNSSQSFSVDSGIVSEEFSHIDFETLVEYFQHPAKFFLKNVACAARPDEDTPPDEDEPQRVGALDRYAEKLRLVELNLKGESWNGEVAASLSRGIFPWGAYGEAQAASIRSEALVFCNELKPAISPEPRFIRDKFEAGKDNARVFLDLALGPVHGGVLLSYRCAQLRTKDILRAWMTAIAVSAMREKGVDDASAIKGVEVLAGDGAHKLAIPPDGMRRLGGLIDIYREGLSRPLPIFAEASFEAGAERPKSRTKPMDRAAKKWYGNGFGGTPSECDDPYNRAAWRGRDPLVECEAEFLDLSKRIWTGYSACEKEGF